MMINGKITLLWIGNRKGLRGVGIFLTKNWVDKVIDISISSDRMSVIKLLVQENINSVISVYASQDGLDGVSPLIDKGMCWESIS